MPSPIQARTMTPRWHRTMGMYRIFLCKYLHANGCWRRCVGGDIASTFEELRIQVPAGLNMGLSGISWWTTDVGGFFDGDPENPSFREFLVRWFQYGAFCPVFRLHSFHLPAKEAPVWHGGPNEV